MALVQQDMKKLIAYSSIAHMGFAVLGCFMIYSMGSDEAYMSFEGAVVQMIAHAFNTGGLFLAVGMMQYWVGSRNLKDWGGLAIKNAYFCHFYDVICIIECGFPRHFGFCG